MGGLGSGRHSLSDDEKRKRGTFKESESEAARLAKNAQKVITGPWLTAIPEPTIPLDAVGKAEYERLTKLLFNGNKLTSVTCGDCERMAVMKQQMASRLAAGKSVSMDLIKRMDAISVRLRIAEDAPAIANPNQKSRFEGSGFANNRATPFRLRPLAAAGKGEL